MGLFGTKKVKETTAKDCVKMIEKFYKNLGFDPNAHLLNDPDTMGWYIQRGSVLIFIILNDHNGLNTVRVVAPIVYIPEENILPFYRRCLEINTELINCALGVIEDRVIMVSERPILGLDEEELEGTLNYLSAVADDLDNELASEFGAKIYTEETQ